MYEDTPNQEEIDWFVDRMREIYDYDRLKDCDIDYLYNQEFGTKNDSMFFRQIFPADDSLVEGNLLAYANNQENIDRESLTPAEWMRLHMLEKEIEIEIRRAFGHRKQLRREHRSKLVNSVSDMIDSIVSILPWKNP